MKKQITILSLLISSIAISQTQGEITYTSKVNMHINLGDDANSDMIRNMIPEFQESKSKLLFTTTQSLYENLPEEETAQEIQDEGEGNVQIKIEFTTPDEKTYTDLKTGIIVEQRDLMGKIFLVKDTLKKSDWHVIDEHKLVSDLMCQKAQLINETDTITAWFTTKIPASTGPMGFGGLPGLIVKISMDQGSFEIIATNIQLRKIGPKEIKIPKKGKEISAQKFDELEQKKRKEMEEYYQGVKEDGGTVIMISN